MNGMGSVHRWLEGVLQYEEFECLCLRAQNFEYGSLLFKFHVVIKGLCEFSLAHQDPGTLFLFF